MEYDLINIVAEQQLRRLAILEYFYSHNKGSISMINISKHLEKNNIPVTVKIVQKEIDALISYGINIVRSKRDTYQYNVPKRIFIMPEMQVLNDNTLEALVFKRNPKTLAYIESLCKQAIEKYTQNMDELLALYSKTQKLAFEETEKQAQKLHDFALADKLFEMQTKV